MWGSGLLRKTKVPDTGKSLISSRTFGRLGENWISKSDTRTDAWFSLQAGIPAVLLKS